MKVTEYFSVVLTLPSCSSASLPASGRNGLEVLTALYTDKEIFVRGDILLRWSHLCLILAHDVTVYVDGELKTTLKTSLPSDLRPGVQGGGVLILGQDQDKPGGGFAPDDSFSGALADLQMFSRALTPEEVSSLSQCHMPPSDSFLTLEEDWNLNNVSQYTISRQDLCIPVHHRYIIFHRFITPSVNRQLCERLHGSLPREEDVQNILSAAEQYLNYRHSNYIKLHFHLEADKSNETGFKEMKVTWGPEEDINVSIFTRPYVFNITTPICKIPVKTYFRLVGLPDTLSDKVDTKYQLHMQEGYHYLRGVERSYFSFDEGSWCLHVLNQPQPVMCHESVSDFPPIGRRTWKDYNDQSSSTLVLTTCHKGQFTCDCGDCISLRQRCNSLPDCDDRSDEDKCDMVKMDHIQRGSLTSVPSQPLHIGARIRITNIPQIIFASGDYATNLLISLSWQDERQSFYNLLPGSVHYLDLQWLSYKMWVPKILLRPTRGGNDAKATKVTIRMRPNCPGEPALSSTREGIAWLYSTRTEYGSSMCLCACNVHSLQTCLLSPVNVNSDTNYTKEQNHIPTPPKLHVRKNTIKSTSITVS